MSGRGVKPFKLSQRAHAALEELQLLMRKPDGYKPNKHELVADVLEKILPAMLAARKLERAYAGDLLEGERYAVSGRIMRFIADVPDGMDFCEGTIYAPYDQYRFHHAMDFEKIVKDSGLFP